MYFICLWNISSTTIRGPFNTEAVANAALADMIKNNEVEENAVVLGPIPIASEIFHRY